MIYRYTYKLFTWKFIFVIHLSLFIRNKVRRLYIYIYIYIYICKYTGVGLYLFIIIPIRVYAIQCVCVCTPQYYNMYTCFYELYRYNIIIIITITIIISNITLNTGQLYKCPKYTTCTQYNVCSTVYTVTLM